jgi:predicted transcriptional regulator
MVFVILMKQPEINSLLLQLSNPIKRKIIKRLSQEPSYQLELSKEMGIGQQLIASHLNAMERNGIVTSSTKPSPRGPKRKLYVVNKNVSIHIDFGSHLYNEKSISIDSFNEEALEDTSNLIRRINEVQEYPEDISKIASLATMLKEVDLRILNLEEERTALLYIRNQIMEKLGKTLGETDRRTDEKRVFHYILNEHDRDIEKISKSLNLMESEIRTILEHLKNEIENI